MDDKEYLRLKEIEKKYNKIVELQRKRCKEYAKKNKEKLKAYAKEYYMKNKKKKSEVKSE